MGASNVAKAFTYWLNLDHREMRALVFMANISLDSGAPPVYFGGWEALAAALGADPEGKRDSARRTAVRVLGSLAKAGAIVSSGQARTGVRAEYALALDPSFTFLPVGKGRGITWQQIPRSLEAESDKASRSEVFATGFADGLPKGLPKGYAIDPAHPETATGTQGETARGTHPETATGTQGETARVPNLRQLGVPQGTTSGTTEEYLEEKLEEQHQSVSQLTREPTQKNADAENLHQKVDDEKTFSEDQERQRQMAALQHLMKAEQEQP
ncbi:hypothetical protein [Glutamicibacter nicotianae]|uniref:hypothetical protein n=1 Tax=Glutamicibacter nicotianae TaxID=37929 RepID=UPI000EF92DCE|nr:hypothetical protein [Glutamicibacter nicotianae]